MGLRNLNPGFRVRDFGGKDADDSQRVYASRIATVAQRAQAKRAYNP